MEKAASKASLVSAFTLFSRSGLRLIEWRTGFGRKTGLSLHCIGGRPFRRFVRAMDFKRFADTPDPVKPPCSRSKLSGCVEQGVERPTIACFSGRIKSPDSNIASS
ncbi:hypothetical protein F5X97DRAFT_325941 [Nemania serpens]|nr:hypothetical protein F5X97DRAFT_325941 [Nemania serpens]